MRPTPKLAALINTCALALLAAVLLGRPELAAIGAAFAAITLRGLLTSGPRIGAASAHSSPSRLLEGDHVEVSVAVDALDAARASVELIAPQRMAPAAVGMACTPDVETVLTVKALRWGRTDLGVVKVQAVDRAALRMVTTTVDAGIVRVLPNREHLTTLLDAAWTQARAGTQVARERGEGSELAELRSMRPGDPRRRIAWRASGRRGHLVIADRHADRNADIVLLIDTFAEARHGAAGTLGTAVRSAAALADGHLRRMDRVAVVGFGGVLHWLAPATGHAAAYRILDALVDSEIITSYADKDIALIPPRILPARSLVIALSPLLDARGVAGLLDLRARGFDLTVLDVTPEPYLPRPHGMEEELARRVWRLQRSALRTRLQRAGAAVTTITSDASLAMPLEEVTQWRRFATPAAPHWR